MFKINKKLVDYFEDNNITAQMIAERINSDRSAIYKILKGQRSIGINVAKKLSEYYNWPLKDIFDTENIINEPQNQKITQEPEPGYHISPTNHHKKLIKMETNNYDEEKLRDLLKKIADLEEKILGFNDKIELYKSLLKAKEELIEELREQKEILKQRNECYSLIEQKGISPNTK